MSHLQKLNLLYDTKDKLELISQIFNSIDLHMDIRYDILDKIQMADLDVTMALTKIDKSINKIIKDYNIDPVIVGNEAE